MDRAGRITTWYYCRREGRTGRRYGPAAGRIPAWPDEPLGKPVGQSQSERADPAKGIPVREHRRNKKFIWDGGKRSERAFWR